MKITDINAGVILDKYKDIDEDEMEKFYEEFTPTYTSLIIELEKIEKEELEFLEENNIIYRFKNNKIEIIILRFKTYLVEYETRFREGIYFERTEVYDNYFEEVYHTEEKTDDEKNLIICKDNMKIEILIIFQEDAIEEDKKIFKEYFVDKNYF